MKLYKIMMSNEAKNDLKDIVNYIEENLNNSNIAKKYFNIIKKQIKSLSNLPYRFPVINNKFIQYGDIRMLIIKNYIAFYRVNEKQKVVNIERILFGRTQWK